MTAPFTLTLRKLAQIHHVDHSLLGRWKRDGCDVMDSRVVALRVMQSQLPPRSWLETKAAIFTEDGESHEHWKREKTKEEVESLRLKNARLSGDVFDRADGERVQDAWASALQLALAERRATAPQVLAGKDEAAIAEYLDTADHLLLSALSDLESGLWREVLAGYEVDGEEG